MHVHRLKQTGCCSLIGEINFQQTVAIRLEADALAFGILTVLSGRLLDSLGNLDEEESVESACHLLGVADRLSQSSISKVFVYLVSLPDARRPTYGNL